MDGFLAGFGATISICLLVLAIVMPVPLSKKAEEQRNACARIGRESFIVDHKVLCVDPKTRQVYKPE
jgi:hypothetical protein